MSNEIIVPFQEGDLAGDRYAGPIYELVYPSLHDVAHEAIGWAHLGFSSMRRGGVIAGEVSRTLQIVGDIPDWLQERLRGAGVTITQTKARGPEVSAFGLGLESVFADQISRKE